MLWIVDASVFQDRAQLRPEKQRSSFDASHRASIAESVCYCGFVRRRRLKVSVISQRKHNIDAAKHEFRRRVVRKTVDRRLVFEKASWQEDCGLSTDARQEREKDRVGAGSIFQKSKSKSRKMDDRQKRVQDSDWDR